MSGLAEKLVFGVIAAGLHLLAFLAIPDTGAQSQGAGGTGRVTLQGASPQIEAMVAAWTAPPDTAPPEALSQPQPPVTEPPAPDVPQADNPPNQSVATALPDLPVAPTPPQAAQLPLPIPMPAPTVAEAPALPRPQPTETTGDRPEVPTAPPSPDPPAPRQTVQRPEAPSPPRAPDLAEAMETAPPPPPPAKPETPPAKRAQSASPALQTQKAAGRGGAQQAGTGGQAQSPALGPGQRRNLITAWGAQIINRIERTKRAPRGLRGGGRVILQLAVNRTGELRSVSVRQSSGNPELDAAAISAVRRAGRFPPAPEGLTKPVYSFSLPVRFNR